MENNNMTTNDTSTKVLVFGILGLAFACSFYLSFLGIIFSAIGMSQANNFARENGAVFGKAKVGRILSKVGLPLGIVFTVISVIYIIVMVLLALGRTIG